MESLSALPHSENAVVVMFAIVAEAVVIVNINTITNILNIYIPGPVLSALS